MGNQIARRLRAAAVIAAMWAILWGIAGGVLLSVWYAVIGRTLGDTGGYFYLLRETVLGAAGLGVFAGVLFGLALATLGREERVRQLTLSRVALFGGLAGFLVSVVFPPDFIYLVSTKWIPVAALCTGLFSGGLSSWLTLAVAEQAPKALPDVDTPERAALPG